MRRSRFAQVLSWICLTSIALVSFTVSSAAQNSSGFGGSNVPRGVRKGVNKPRLECIEFEEFGTGAIVSTINQSLGTVLVSGHNPDLGNTNAAIIFDSANPTGGDFDLGTPNQNFGGPGIGEAGGPGSPYSNEVPKGKILIIAENLLDANDDDQIDDPDDADVVGAGLSIDMTDLGGVEIVSLFFIDGETDRPPALIHFFDPADNLITQIPVPQVGNNGVVTLPVGVQNVARMFFNINGSFGLDDICYRPMVDCNENGIQDYRDIEDGTSNDCR